MHLPMQPALEFIRKRNAQAKTPLRYIVSARKFSSLITDGIIPSINIAGRYFIRDEDQARIEAILKSIEQARVPTVEPSDSAPRTRRRAAGQREHEQRAE